VRNGTRQLATELERINKVRVKHFESQLNKPFPDIPDAPFLDISVSIDPQSPEEIITAKKDKIPLRRQNI